MRMNRAARWSLLSLGPALVLAGTALWWSEREPGRLPISARGRLDEAAEDAARTDVRARDVLALMREKGIGRQAKLVEFYVRHARDPSATGVRALALNALFAEESLPLRLKGGLEAVSADPTPAREDPLWPKVTQKLAEQWTPEVFDKGRDLMLAEQRPRAKRALIDSFVELVVSARASDLTSEQSAALLSDLIDMHGVAEPDQKSSIRDAVRKLGGNDPADLLAGKGLNDGHKLELQAQYEKDLQAGTNLRGRR